MSIFYKYCSSFCVEYPLYVNAHIFHGSKSVLCYFLCVDFLSMISNGGFKMTPEDKRRGEMVALLAGTVLLAGGVIVAACVYYKNKKFLKSWDLL